VEILSTLDGRTCVAKGECVLTPSGEVPIEKIKPGDLVIGGSREARRVSHTTKKVVNSTLRITLSNGRTIRCTCDHLLLLKSGEWREAGDLREGDEIAEQL
jgi:intein/homing endonuclease